MNVTSHEEYGLRCALQLARVYGRAQLPASRIAEKEGISVEYVSKFMHLFRKLGLVSSVRGTQGGFRLARAPKEINLLELLEALHPKRNLQLNFCQQFSGQRDCCVNLEECSVRPLWSLITFYFDSILKELSLEDLLDSEAEVRSRVESLLLKSIESYRNSGPERKVEGSS